MDIFDPIVSDFDPTVDPLTADEQGLAILAKLEEGQSILNDYNPTAEGVDPVAAAKMNAVVEENVNSVLPQLQKKLSDYRDYKVARGEKLFSYEEEVLARRNGFDTETLARSAIKMIQADEETFNAMLEENGDAEDYRIGQAFMQDKTTLRKEYTLRKLLKQSGYSEREIDSGAAEPHMRKRLGADENQSEPTINAYSRWSLSKVNEFDRRRHIQSEALNQARSQYLGMQGDEDTFEKSLADANPDITDEERVYARRIRNLQFEQMDKTFGDIRPLVRKTFNTIANDEGITSKFTEEGDEAFASLDEAISAMGDIPRKDFDKLLLALSETAKAHGQDVDGFMNKAVKNFTRAGAELFADNGVRQVEELAGVERLLKGTEKVDSKKPFRYPVEVFNKDGESQGFHSVSAFGQIGEGFGSYRGLMTPEQAADATNQMKTKLFGEGTTVRAVTEEPQLKEAQKEFSKRKRAQEYSSEIRNWRDAVARVGGDNWFTDNFVYGAIRSIPEMGAAATGVPGILLVANAQKERNMAEIRRSNPNGDWQKSEPAADVAAFGYALLNRAQFTTLSNRLPATKSFVGEMGKRVFVEAIQESGQDLTLATTLEFYGALNEDIKDFELTTEFVDTVKRFPKTMLAVTPLVLAGGVGGKAMGYLDSKAYDRILRDSELMGLYGIDAETQAQIRELSTEDALDFIQENNSKFIANMQELPTTNVETEVQTIVREDGTFAVTDGGNTLIARSPQEVAEAVRQLDPEVVQRSQKAQEAQAKADSVQSVEIQGITVDVPTKDLNIDPDFNAAATNFSFIAPNFGSPNAPFEAGESRSRIREGLPPIPDEATNEYTWRARKRFGLQQWFSQRDVPSKTLQKTLDEGNRLKKGIESQFNEIAKSLDTRINKHIKRQPSALRDVAYSQIQADTYRAIRGDDAAMKALPPKIREAAEIGRKSIDIYSQELIDTGAVSNTLADKVGGNIGTYVTREFKVYDAKSGWNYANVKKQHPEVYQDALRYIKETEGVDTKEADLIIHDMLDPSKARGFVSGTDSIKKINVSNFIQKKDLAPEILELLGEVKNPAVNIRNTGKVVSNIAVVNATQAHMAEQLIAAGLGSRTPNRELRHTERLGGKIYDFVKEGEDGGKSTVGHGVKTDKAFTGFGEIYLEPELAQHLKAYFEGGSGKKSGFSQASDLLATVTGIGKFSQVILNPAAYPTNFLGGVATEIFNGRMSLDAKGARAYFKRGSVRNREKTKPYGVEQQQELYNITNAEFAKLGGVNTLEWNQINTELEQRGLRDNSVIAEDLNQTVERGLGDAVGKGVRVLSRAYQAPDNAIKRSAFIHELDLFMRAMPDATVGEAIQLAAENVRMTTQNYDMVPDILRQFSQRGVIVPTYISFTYELFRNTANTARLASREIRSDNPVLRANGFKRVAGMAAVGGLLYLMNETLSSFMSGLSGDEEEELRALLPPWLEDSEVIMLGADNKSLAYFDGSYLIPHQIFYNAVSRAVKQDNIGDSTKAFAKSITAPIGGLNIFHQTAAEALVNKKREGGSIYDAEIAIDDPLYKTRAITEHFVKSMFLPGVVRTYDKVKKAETHEIGFAGSSATMDDIYAGLLGIRPYRLDTSSDAFLNDNLIEFARRSADAKGHASERKQGRRTQAEAEEAEKAVTVAQERLKEKFLSKVAAFKALGISDDRIQKSMKEVKIPRYMREALKD